MHCFSPLSVLRYQCPLPCCVGLPSYKNGLTSLVYFGLLSHFCVFLGLYVFCFFTYFFWGIAEINVWVWSFIFIYFILFYREGKGRRKRGRETSMCGCLLHTPHWEPGLQYRHTPRLGIEPVTPWFPVRCSIHLAIPTRTDPSYLISYQWSCVTFFPLFIFLEKKKLAPYLFSDFFLMLRFDYLMCLNIKLIKFQSLRSQVLGIMFCVCACVCV